MMNSECDELLSEILSHPSLNAASSVNAANLQSSEEESESESGLFLASETQYPGRNGSRSRHGKPKLSLLRRQKAEMKAQMQDLRAKIYQNQLMSLAGFSLGSYPLFNGPPQESVEISVDLETHQVNLNPGYLANIPYQMPAQQSPAPQNHPPVTPQLRHQSPQAPDMLHMIKQQQEQIELLKNQLNPNFQRPPSEDLSARQKYEKRRGARQFSDPPVAELTDKRSFSRASTCSNRSKGTMLAPKPALRKMLPTLEKSPKIHVRRLASLMFPREEKVSQSTSEFGTACSSVTNETDEELAFDMAQTSDEN